MLAYIYSNSINQLIFAMVMYRVSFAVRTEFLYVLIKRNLASEIVSLCVSLSFDPYQKDEWTLPGDLTQISEYSCRVDPFFRLLCPTSRVLFKRRNIGTV